MFGFQDAQILRSIKEESLLRGANSWTPIIDTSPARYFFILTNFFNG